MSRRILDETTKSTFASDDYLYMDGATDGSSKITPDNLVRNTTVAQQLAQHIADAEEEVEQITADIEGIQSDINDVKSDLGDLEDLETEDTSSIVNAINEVASGADAEAVNALIEAYITEHHIEGVTEAEVQEMVETYLEGGSVEDAVNDWLVAHPEATTTVQDGAITEAKLANDVKQKLENTSAYVTRYIGELFEKPNNRTYVGWALNNTRYDSQDDTINVIVNAASTHAFSKTDISACDLYLYKFKRDDLSYTVIPILESGTFGANVTNAFTLKCIYTYSFCIANNGTYIFMPNYNDAGYVFKSTDHGATWTVSQCTFSTTPNEYCFTGLMQTSSGRFIVSTHSGYFWYSDDSCATWTRCATPTSHSTGHEATIVEVETGKLLALMRKSFSGSTASAVPAQFSVSTDNGLNWTNPTDSTTIVDSNQSGIAVAVSGNTVYAFATSRTVNGSIKGAIYQYKASLSDSLMDGWTGGDVVRYANAITEVDFGYPSCCVDSDKNIHLFYYDGDSNQSGSTNYYYIQAVKEHDNIPINADKYTIGSPTFPYSASTIDQKLLSLKTQLMAKINQIIIDGGGTVPDEGDGSFYTTDGLYDFIDFTDSSRWDSTAGTYTGTSSKLVMKPDTDSGSQAVGGGSDGAVNTVICPSITSGDLPYTAGVTIEFSFYANAAYTTNVYSVLNTNKTGNSGFNHVTLSNDGKLNIRYTNTSSASAFKLVSPNDFTVPVYKAGLHHVVLVVTDTYTKSYYDGVKINEQTFANMDNFSSMNYSELNMFSIAGIWNNANALSVKSCRVYAKELTAAEVTNNYTYETNLWS